LAIQCAAAGVINQILVSTQLYMS